MADVVSCERCESFLRRLTLVCCGIAAGIVGLAMYLDWLVSFPLLVRKVSFYMPMAPSTAFLLLVLIFILFLHTARYPARPFIRPVLKICTLAVFIIPFFVLLRLALSPGLDVEKIFISNSVRFHGIFAGRMAPLSAVNFFFAAAALFILLNSSEQNIRLKQIAVIFSMFVACVGAAMLIVYFYNSPVLLYRGTIKPMVVFTSAAFLSLGVGLIAACGSFVWPTRQFIGNSIYAQLLRVFVPLLVFFVLFDGWLHGSVLTHKYHPVFEAAVVLVLFMVIYFPVIAKPARIVSRQIETAEAERLLAKQEYRYLEAKYKVIVDNTLVGVYQSKPDGTVLFANSSVLNLLEYDSEEDMNLHGGASVLYKNPEDRQRLIKIIKQKGYVDNYELELVTKTGKQRNILLNMRLDNDILSGIVVDITERKKAQEREKDLIKEKLKADIELAKAEEIRSAYEELKNMQFQLIQAEKLASIGQLSASVAHELNSPLDGLMSLLRSYRKNTDEGSSAHRELTVMLDAAEYMAGIVHQLVSFAGESKGELVELHFNDIVNNTLVFVSGLLAEKGIVIKKDLDPNLSKIKGEKNQLQQVVLNLVNNSCDASPRGSEVIIKTRNSGDGGSVIAEFIDNGIGIRPEDLPKIFDPFFTTKDTGKGVGLGLFVSQGIVRQHNANMVVESQWGHGTKVTITFPVTR